MTHTDQLDALACRPDNSWRPVEPGWTLTSYLDDPTVVVIRSREGEVSASYRRTDLEAALFRDGVLHLDPDTLREFALASLWEDAEGPCERREALVGWKRQLGLGEHFGPEDAIEGPALPAGLYPRGRGLVVIDRMTRTYMSIETPGSSRLARWRWYAPEGSEWLAAWEGDRRELWRRCRFEWSPEGAKRMLALLVERGLEPTPWERAGWAML